MLETDYNMYKGSRAPSRKMAAVLPQSQKIVCFFEKFVSPTYTCYTTNKVCIANSKGVGAVWPKEFTAAAVAAAAHGHSKIY